jgi:hypothetical protein
MVVRLAGMITAYDEIKTRCKGYLEEGRAKLEEFLEGKEVEVPWWQVPNQGGGRRREA